MADVTINDHSDEYLRDFEDALEIALEKIGLHIEGEAKEEVESMGVIEMADTQSEILLKGLIQDTIPQGYSIKVKAQ